MKRIKLRARMVAVALLSLLMIFPISFEGVSKKASAISISSGFAEAFETPVPQRVAVNTEHVEGKVYTFDKDAAYSFSSNQDAISSSDTQTYGTFSIAGTDLIAESGTKNGVAAYSIPEGTVVIQYTYSDERLDAADEEWHLIDDPTTAIDVFKIDSSIQKGAIILQKSMDHMNWYNVSVQTNAFENTPVQDEALYETTDLEMINGCYYRLIVAYELAQKVGTSTVAWVIPKDVMAYQRIAEVYEFYVAGQNGHIEPLASNTKRYSLGETVLVSDFASYSGEKEMNPGDLHYGWKLGNFFVSGFTSAAYDQDEVIFLKNAGDVVTLWFHLTQNINALNHDSALTITSDSDGLDRYFQTPMTNFGKGMLIVRYTDHENVMHDPVMYHDYLLANTMMGANTRVQLFEEGDYEVALDYEVTRNQFIPQTHHYRIFMKFSVRNANCMVYPFDIATGAELTNRSVTENGFCLDLARSRYLNLYIKKEVWTEGADGLTEDTRFNTTAKDGDRYTDEGIYTITAKNQYTGIETTKKIYVGTNRILAAYANSNYSIAEIQRMVEQGATIYEDGTISMPTSIEPILLPEQIEETLTEPVSSGHQTAVESPDAHDSPPVVVILCAVVVALAVAMVGLTKKHRGKEGRK